MQHTALCRAAHSTMQSSTQSRACSRAKQSRAEHSTARRWRVSFIARQAVTAWFDSASLPAGAPPPHPQHTVCRADRAACSMPCSTQHHAEQTKQHSAMQSSTQHAMQHTGCRADSTAGSIPRGTHHPDQQHPACHAAHRMQSRQRSS